jgi:hypothetical protein
MRPRKPPGASGRPYLGYAALRAGGRAADRRVLAPMYLKEMVYRVLQREQYARLLAIAAAESANNPVSAVLEYV